MAHKKHHKKGAWFYSARNSYLPCSWQAWTLYGLMAIYILPSFWLDLINGQSTIYVATNFATRIILAGLVVTFIATKKS